MINQKNKKKERVGKFGASDTTYIMMDWGTSTFINWWLGKLGFDKEHFTNIYLIAGTYEEHKIANWYKEKYNVKLKLDRKVSRLKRKYRLVVNLDAETKNTIVEIKTFRYQNKPFKCPKSYWQQVQVQMFATKKTDAKIVAYGLLEEDYNNFYLPISDDRIFEISIDYDNLWITNEYLPRLKFLKKCLKTREIPNLEKFEKWRNKYEK